MTKIKEALILAGGKGTRLAKVLNGKPKPLVEIGGIPLLKHQINLLLKFNINKIYLLVNYKANLIQAFLENEYKEIHFEILEDGEYPLGTGGSILKHLNRLEDRFVVLYGDTFLNVNLDNLNNFHESKKADLTVFAHPNSHPYDSDVIICNSNDKVIEISGYPHKESFYSANLVNAALYVVEKQILKSLPRLSKKLIDFAKDLIPLYLDQKKKIFAYKSREYIKDCGTEDRLEKVENDYFNKRHLILSDNNPIPSVFLDRDGTIIENVDHLNSISQINFLENSLEAIKSFNSNNFLVSIVTNQPVIARGELSPEGLNDIHNFLEWEAGKKGAYFDNILFCPHYPQSGFLGEVKELKINCNCRKPDVGMLQLLSNKYNIDKNKSWIIGDSSADIKCGNDFKIKTILLETGFSGKDNKFFNEPDYVFRDLFIASVFINEEYPKLINIANQLKINEKFNNIFISGISKSGKSTFSSVLKDFIQKKFKVKCHVIRLDNYMLEPEKRGSFPKIYDLEKIENIFRDRHEGKSITILKQRYDKFNRTIVYSNDFVTINKNEWVIFEGLISFNLSNKLFSNNQFYIECDEIKNKERFKRDYIHRGLKENTISDLFQERSLERSLVKKQKSYQNLKLINL
jgi:histidinol-phosphate phosphatase family protein